MKTQWKRRLLQLTISVTAEIVLNVIGLDTLADYSEFVFSKDLGLDIATILTSRQSIG